MLPPPQMRVSFIAMILVLIHAAYSSFISSEMSSSCTFIPFRQSGGGLLSVVGLSGILQTKTQDLLPQSIFSSHSKRPKVAVQKRLSTGGQIQTSLYATLTHLQMGVWVQPAMCMVSTISSWVSTGDLMTGRSMAKWIWGVAIELSAASMGKEVEVWIRMGVRCWQPAPAVIALGAVIVCMMCMMCVVGRKEL